MSDDNYLEQLSKKYKLWWLLDYDERDDNYKYYNPELDKYNLFFKEAIFNLKSNNLDLGDLVSFIDRKLECSFEVIDDQIEDVYDETIRLLADEQLSNRDLESLKFNIINKLNSRNRVHIEFALRFIHDYIQIMGNYFLNDLIGTIFEEWGDIYDWLQKGDNTWWDNIGYHERRIDRRKEVLELIYKIDKESLIKPMERVLSETHIGWGTNWDQLLALEYLFKIDNSKWAKQYLSYIISNLSYCESDDEKAKMDYSMAIRHLYNFDEEFAIRIFVEVIEKDNYKYFEDIMRYKCTIKKLIANKEDNIKLFIKELSKMEIKSSKNLIEMIYETSELDSKIIDALSDK